MKTDKIISFTSCLVLALLGYSLAQTKDITELNIRRAFAGTEPLVNPSNVIAAREFAPVMLIEGDPGFYIEINLTNGAVKVRGWPLDEASSNFWATVTRVYPHIKEQICK